MGIHLTSILRSAAMEDRPAIFPCGEGIARAQNLHCQSLLPFRVTSTFFGANPNWDVKDFRIVKQMKNGL